MRAAAYAQMIVAGAVLCIGGPALVYYVMPTEEELFKKYNPELQKRSLENRYERQKQFDDFVTKLKEHAKSDKPIWAAVAEAQAKERDAATAKARADRHQVAEDLERRKQDIRRQSTSA